MDTSGINAGYLNFLNHSLQRDRAQLDNDMARFRMAEALRTQQARPLAGRVLQDVFAGGGTPMLPPAPQPPQPGQPSVAAGPPQGPMPQSGAPQQVQPWKTFDDHVASAQNQPAIPAAPQAAPAMPAAPQRKLDIGSIIKTMKQNNVSDAMTMDVLDNLLPFMNAENKAEYQALKSQMDITREADRMTIARMQDEQKTLERERKAERDDWQKGNATQRIGILRDKVTAENRRTEIFVKQNELRARNQQSKESMDRLKALNIQLGRVQQLIPSLESAVVNGTPEVRQAAAARLEAINMEVDALQDRMSTETNAFLNHAAQGEETPVRPTGAAGKTGENASRPPKPNDPGFDYRFDETRGVWQRRPK